EGKFGRDGFLGRTGYLGGVRTEKTDTEAFGWAKIRGSLASTAAQQLADPVGAAAPTGSASCCAAVLARLPRILAQPNASVSVFSVRTPPRYPVRPRNPSRPNLPS